MRELKPGEDHHGPQGPLRRLAMTPYTADGYKLMQGHDIIHYFCDEPGMSGEFLAGFFATELNKAQQGDPRERAFLHMLAFYQKD